MSLDRRSDKMMAQEEQTALPIILVIDDDPVISDMIRDLLSRSYQVLVASNGEEGLQTATELIPDLVICDVTMPLKDGYEVCVSLRADQRTSHIPVVLLTGRGEPEHRIDGFDSGADAYVTKPFHPDELLARVRNLIAIREKLIERYRTGIPLQKVPVSAPSMSEQFLQKVTDVIVAHLHEEHPSIESLCREIGMSRSQVHRKLVALTGMSISDHLRRMRLHHAMDLLKANHATVSEVAYQVGFGSVAYFSKCFREEFGTTPSEARKKSSGTAAGPEE